MRKNLVIILVIISSLIVAITVLGYLSWSLTSIIVVTSLLFILYLMFNNKLTSKEIIIISSLAAIAAVGRIPFVAFPNIQPTTFIVIITGYVFGPFSGLLVGFISALASNFVLGHGPWTPWQMLAWGLAGLSAGYLKSFAPKISSLQLAVFCGIWGFLFGWIMNFTYWFTFITPLNLQTYLATYIFSFNLDLLHSLFNISLALTLGKTLINILEDYKDRLQLNKS